MVTASKTNEPFVIKSDGHFEFQLTPEQATGLDVVADGAEAFQILSNGKSYHAELLSADYAARIFKIRVNGHIHELQIADKYARLIEKMGLKTGGAAKLNTLKAPMPGLVLDVLVSPGQSIKKGEGLLILEAMKMENILKAPLDVVVKSVQVQKGQAVDKGTLLVEFE